jgi:hypothetical protein
MICFEVTINGEKACTAGVGDAGVLSTILTFAKRFEESQENQDQGKSEHIDLRVGGIANVDAETSEHVDWIHRDLSPGDEISIKVIEAAKCDRPASKETSYLRCSFCGKKQSEVLKLIAGPTNYICNECVYDCSQAIAEGEPIGAITLVLGKQAEARCSFCGKKPVEVDRVVGNTVAHICIECIKVCGEIVRDDT